MIEMRRTTVLADVHDRGRGARGPSRALSLVRVGATTEWTYTDGNDVEWSVEDRADSVPAGQRFVGSTEAYPETTYKFYEPTKEALYATIERVAKAQSSTESYSVGGGGEAPAPEPTGAQAPAPGAPAPAPTTDAAPGPAPAGGGIVQRFSRLSTPKKVGVVALAALVVGGVAWAVL